MGKNPGSRREKNFPIMDSLRALGAVGVIAVHAIHTGGVLPPGTDLERYVMRMDIAVPMFFAISGFLLYRPFVRAHLSAEERPEIGDYGWRRVLRIVPGYWVALTICAVWIGLANVFTPGGIVSYYGFAQIYRDATFDGGLVQAWTIAVEVVFYAFLPLYVLLMQRLLRHSRPDGRLRGEVIGVAVLFAVGMAYNVVALAVLGPIDQSMAPILFAFPAFINQFAVGMALAIWSVHSDARHEQGAARDRAVRVIERWPSVPIAVVVIAFLVLVNGLSLHDGNVTDAEWLQRHLLNTLIACALLLPTIFGDIRVGVVRRILRNRVLLYLGIISYGTYLYHLGVLVQLERWGVTGAFGGGEGGYLVYVALAAVGSIALGALSWHVLERRCLRQIHRIRAWRTRRAPEVPVPAEPAAAAATASATDR